MDYDIDIDYMDMRDDGRVWALLDHARPGLVPLAAYVTVGSEDARPSVAQILSANVDGQIELRVVPGTVEQNCPCFQPLRREVRAAYSPDLELRPVVAPVEFIQFQLTLLMLK